MKSDGIDLTPEEARKLVAKAMSFSRAYALTACTSSSPASGRQP